MVRKSSNTIAGDRNLLPGFWALIRLSYVLLVPAIALVILSIDGLRTGLGWALGLVVGLFLYSYLQAAVIATEYRRGAVRRPEWLRALLPVLIVGVASSFEARRWIVEQMLLEAGAFSLAVAMVALEKGAQQGRQAPWGAILLVFLAPALGIVAVVGKALIRQSADGGTKFELVRLGLLAAAFGVAVWDTRVRFRPFALGGDQLTEPIARGWHLVLVVLWLLTLLVGVPWLLTR